LELPNQLPQVGDHTLERDPLTATAGLRWSVAGQITLRDCVGDSRHVLLIRDHVTHRADHLADLALRSHPDLLVQVAGGEAPRGPGDLADGAGNAARKEQSD